MCYDLQRSRYASVEMLIIASCLLLHQVRLCYRKRPCMFSAYYNFIMSVYCLVKATKFYMQQLDLLKLQ